MASIPHELDGARVLQFAVLDDDVRPTGATRHFKGSIAGGELVQEGRLGPFESLAIAKYDSGSGGFYLFYLDASARVVTDTWHESVEHALRQADFEYEGLRWIERPA